LRAADNKIAVDGHMFGNASQWSCENPDTLRRDLKERIGKGNTSFFVMSDWGAAHHGAPGGFGQGGLDMSQVRKHENVFLNAVLSALKPRHLAKTGSGLTQRKLKAVLFGRSLAATLRT
jgi:hypothetical protein